MTERKYLEYLTVAALLTTFFGYFAVKIWDIDFWWHIAAGKNMIETGIIPGTDPFGVYDAANVWGQTVLKSQWLGQVLLYWTYNNFDLHGVILLRTSVMTLCLLIVYLRCQLVSAATVYSLLITALTGMAILSHTGERPQLFSFLYLSLIFLLLDGYMHKARRWLLYCIPPVMLVWSNTHAGSVLGVAALGLFSAGMLLENRSAGAHLLARPVPLVFLVTCLSVIAMVCTPNGFATIHRIIFVENIFFVGDNPLRDRVSEYAYPWSLWPVTSYYWIFIGITLASIPGFFGRRYWKQGIVVFTIALISLTGYRYIPMFVLLCAPYVAGSLSRLLSRIKLPDIAVNLSALILALALLANGVRQEKIFQKGIQDHRFPSGAVAFIKANNLSGKIFSTMNWGGYLIWNLPLAAKVYIDGRMLDPKRLVPYTHILWTTAEGRQFFEQEEFDLALVPYANAISGEKYPLVDYLVSNAGWRVIYQDEMGYLFAKRAQ